MLNNINLNLLRSLHVLIEECHVSRTAKRLHITQSAVSRQLAQLRELCGDPLLVRQGNQLIATPRAIVLKEKLDSLLSEFEHLLDDKPFDPEDWQGELVLASSDYVAQYVLPDIAAHLSDLAPQLDMAYRLWQPELLDKLHETGIHIASSMYPEKPVGVSSIHIGSDSSVCLMKAGHPLAKKDEVTVSELTHFSHIKVTGGGDKDSDTELALKAQGYSRHVTLKVPFFSAAVNRLVSSEHLMVVPEHIAVNLAKHWPLVYKPLPFTTQTHQYWLMWHPKYDNDPAHKWVREEMRVAMRLSEYSIR
ncbi:transcriptional regulator [Vibrio sp. 10N.286.49.C2]|uniref:LysR family transcriptional regulator n=1 Tax=unclassified Vibrio TaxID=2614977 RepID=UPI000C842784|nr:MULTISPECIES: LysR family transcriptional regulator [unclassified Vibrio]PMH31507.1 transcriptional regulator [Vibrio sp. 10N.286.49.C2]PMH50528.1 transcriptional regulator [Vibrio sp. 10N.286.49.B1]PMH77990.1 transcriptional regulator [Vibrio sp. 10N.286.48.B7]